MLTRLQIFTEHGVQLGRYVHMDADGVRQDFRQSALEAHQLSFPWETE